MRTSSRLALSFSFLSVLSVCSLPFFSCETAPEKQEEETPSKKEETCVYETGQAPVSVGKTIEKGSVFAGVSEVDIGLPVGTPLGGYTARMKALGGQAPDARRSPHAKAFAPSAGIQTTPKIRAIFLQAGAESVVFLKADLCVAFDRLVFDVERALSMAGFPDSRGHVLFLTSHTHAGPGTYQGTFHLSLGFDLFQEEQYQRLLLAATQAALAAWKAKQPAKFGAGIWDGWDRADEVYADRRKDDDDMPGPDGKPIGKHKEQRLLLLRIDDAKNDPLALISSFPVHGTVGGSDNPFISTDAVGHIELATEDRFSKPVMAMHLQGPAGDASPKGVSGLSACDDKKQLCEDFARMESLGERAAPRLLDLWRSIQTEDTAALEIATRSVQNGRELRVRNGMTYAPFDPQRPFDTSGLLNPDGSARSPITQFNVPFGAGLCGDKKPVLPVDGIPGATGVPYASCAELSSAQTFISAILRVPEPRLPGCETTRTTLSALRLSGLPLFVRTETGGPVEEEHLKNETLLLATLPGEPVSLLADALRKKSPAGENRTFVLGYAQGHIGYLLGVENWLRGGYEPSINIFGPLEGEWLLERSLELLQVAMTPEKEDPEVSKMGRFDRLSFSSGTPQKITPVASAFAGQIPAQIPADLFVRSQRPTEAQPAAFIKRVSGRAVFVFYGGDPEEDTPSVRLERETSPSKFSPVLDANGRNIGPRGRDVLLTYTPSPVDAAPGKAEAHLWALEWQAVGYATKTAAGIEVAAGIPVGNYRFFVTGKSGGKTYQVTSRPFSVTAQDALRVTATRNGAKISGQAVFPVGAGFRLLRLTGPSDGDVPTSGSLRVTAQSKKDGKTEVQTLPAPLGQFSLDCTLDTSLGIDLTVEDEAGNTGKMNL